MVNPRLKNVCYFIDSWCEDHGIEYSVVADESDLQGILFFKKDRPIVRQLLNDIDEILERDGVHLETTKVRGGTILAFSIKAIAETGLAAIPANAGEEPMTFTERLTNAFLRTVASEPTPEDLNEGVFAQTALKIVEGQYKPATQGATRSNQTSLQRQRVGSNTTLGGVETGLVIKKPQKPQKPVTFENRVAGALELSLHHTKNDFNRQLHETLQGMATPDGAQPADMFQKFAKSLVVLGQNLGIGPLQDQLKQQGINWKKSDDGQAIILYVVNAQTQAPQPIARINSETLAKPSDFESQLLNIMDFAKGDAPGSFKQRQQELQSQEKAVREIAKSLGPQDNAIAQQMQGEEPAPAQAAAPAAAQQAAMPKQPATPIPQGV